jgi:glutamate dehydrogenase/leucine dehydrogenase
MNRSNDVKYVIKEASEILNISEKVMDYLLIPDKIFKLNLKFEYKGKIEYIDAYRVIAPLVKAKSIGGVMINENVNEEFLILHSFTETILNSILKTPFTGSFGGIKIKEFQKKDREFKNKVLVKYIENLSFWFKEKKDIITRNPDLEDEEMYTLYKEMEKYTEGAEYIISSKPFDLGGIEAREEIIKRGLKVILKKFSELEGVELKGKEAVILGLTEEETLLSEALKEEGVVIKHIYKEEKFYYNEKGFSSEEVKNIKERKTEHEGFTSELREIKGDIVIISDPNLDYNFLEESDFSIIIECLPFLLPFSIHKNLLKQNKKCIPSIILRTPFTLYNIMEIESKLFSLGHYERRLKNSFSDVFALSVAKSIDINLAGFVMGLGRLLKTITLKGF